MDSLEKVEPDSMKRNMNWEYAHHTLLIIYLMSSKSSSEIPNLNQLYLIKNTNNIVKR